ncbi:Uncharacterised protein [Mycobacterium tuberculosis]|uniref:Uncharacterized protein n=1 Tax=Mycobacterium tuberculosis TaxID=1773 RepID=A0A0T9C729_MYCTX|nr:Uncharacterised protein [Mycobacterium tuberculosis]CFE55529.1 Uncharacterised protein [Mycobacterium tuberculosis]CFR74906.1 Uncharacterised protein [Mycobacterium tuberculosis]CKQ30159.1 Uncharacterised protein [Mycobacterium tuberculosis]CKQ90253.1 Uncharacterised protein [Mycobacterium tuberculosis]
MPDAPAKNTCRKVGMASRDSAPSDESSVGTLRQPRTCSPSASAIFCTAAQAAAASLDDCGKNAIPVA